MTPAAEKPKTSREQFEAWNTRSWMSDTTRHGEVGCRHLYVHPPTQFAWEGWQAAWRASRRTGRVRK